MAETNLDFLVKVDITGVQPAGTIKNLTTVLVAFLDDDHSGPVQVDSFETTEDVDVSNYTPAQQKALNVALVQDGVGIVKAAIVGAATDLSEVLDADAGWFALACNTDLVGTQLYNDMLGTDRLIAAATMAPISGMDLYDNVFMFTHDHEDMAFYFAIAAMAKSLAFDPDRRAAQMDWQTLTAIETSNFETNDRIDWLAQSVNVYGVIQGHRIVADGVNTQGLPYNVVISKYWLQARLREAIASTQHRIVNQYGMNPFDNDGIGGMVGVCNTVLSRGEELGHLVAGFSATVAPVLAEVTEADLRDGLLYPTVQAVQKWRLRAYNIRGVIVPTVGGVQ